MTSLAVGRLYLVVADVSSLVDPDSVLRHDVVVCMICC